MDTAIEVETLERKHENRNSARRAASFILSLGFDARMIGLVVVASIPGWERNVIGTLVEMGWSLS
jgi:hypothetical protein